MYIILAYCLIAAVFTVIGTYVLFICYKKIRCLHFRDSARDLLLLGAFFSWISNTQSLPKIIEGSSMSLPAIFHKDKPFLSLLLVWILEYTIYNFDIL